MAQRGSGAIVNVSSMASEFGMQGLALYGSSKAALDLLTKAWAGEFGPSGVRVNAVSPGPTRTREPSRWAKASISLPPWLRRIAPRHPTKYRRRDRVSRLR